MFVLTNSGFRAEQLANSVHNSADVICSHTDVLRLFVFTEIARAIPSQNLSLILQARSTGKGYLILVRKSASVPSSAEGRSKEALLLFFQYSFPTCCVVLC